MEELFLMIIFNINFFKTENSLKTFYYEIQYTYPQNAKQLHNFNKLYKANACVGTN